MIKALRIKVALESDCGNGEALPMFPAEQKMGKSLTYSPNSCKTGEGLLERTWLKNTFLGKKLPKEL